MSLQHVYAVEHDGSVTSRTQMDPRARAIIERMARCVYVIDKHREGIAINSRRLAELQAELDRIEGGR